MPIGKEMNNRLKEEVAKCVAAGSGVISGRTMSRRYCFPPSFIGFSGHFPGYPVLPAFIQVMAAMMTVEEFKGCPCEFSSLERAKFRMEIRPDQPVDVTCTEYGPQDDPAFQVRVNTAEGVAASFSMKIIIKGSN